MFRILLFHGGNLKLSHCSCITEVKGGKQRNIIMDYVMIFSALVLKGLSHLCETGPIFNYYTYIR